MADVPERWPVAVAQAARRSRGVVPRTGRCAWRHRRRLLHRRNAREPLVLRVALSGSPDSLLRRVVHRLEAPGLSTQQVRRTLSPARGASTATAEYAEGRGRPRTKTTTFLPQRTQRTQRCSDV